jgi:hypothetical protein
VVTIDSHYKSSTGSSVSRGRYSGILLSDLRMEAARLRKSRKTQKAVLDFACCSPCSIKINTDAQSAGPPKLDQPQHNHSTANSRSRRSRNHARGSLGSLGLASLFACCFVPFSLRWFGIRVATLPASLGWASRRPKLCITQLGLAARSSALLVAAARIVRRRVVGLHCAHMLTTPIGPRIVRCSVSLGRAARSPATRRYS